jgi:ankyrin repeat protein
MAVKKRLPHNFDELLQQGDLSLLEAVFETCDVDARGGTGDETALMMRGCPEALTRWLVARGADLAATNKFDRTTLHEQARMRGGTTRVLIELGADVNSVGQTGRKQQTPLHHGALAKNVDAAKSLIDAGARVDAKDSSKQTPLEVALATCSNIEIERMPLLAELLLAAGAPRAASMTSYVREIGKRFEFHRSNFAADRIDATSAALERLYLIFDVEPVPHRVMHDGRSPIQVTSTTWQKQHDELWQLLVPSRGPAATAQGEAIRLSGRLSHEVLDNGAINWDDDFRRMAQALASLTCMGVPLDAVKTWQRDEIIASLVTSADGDVDRLRELAVEWVLANPQPMPLGPRDYNR